jgi:hypothetical protein
MWSLTCIKVASSERRKSLLPETFLDGKSLVTAHYAPRA